LQHVDEARVEGVRLAAVPAQLVEAAHRQRDHVRIPGQSVLVEHLARDARQADAGDARGHSGEELRDQRARQPDRLEIVAAAIGGDHADAHLGHHLEQALVHRLLVAVHNLLQRPRAEQAAPVAVGDALLRQIGVDGGGADTDQDGEVMHVHALGAAHV
jgi:hypothetical protein